MTLDPYRVILDRRLAAQRDGLWDVVTRLRHFALVNYALPRDRLAPHIPADRFEIPEFEIGGRRLALMSAVPFLDVDFHFVHFFPFLKFRFGQTNYRVYVIDKRTSEHLVWFFGTTLGSAIVNLPRRLWRIPWHTARYRLDCQYDSAHRRYQRFVYIVNSDWAGAEVDIEDTGLPIEIAEGFSAMDEMKLILTHPVDGAFHRLDGKLGGYSIWHEEMKLTTGRPRHLYFSLYERLELLSKEEMGRPHSIFLCPETEFKVYLPPRELTS